jgi:hypothetical protein
MNKILEILLSCLLFISVEATRIEEKIKETGLAATSDQLCEKYQEKDPQNLIGKYVECDELLKEHFDKILKNPVGVAMCDRLINNMKRETPIKKITIKVGAPCALSTENRAITIDINSETSPFAGNGTSKEGFCGIDQQRGILRKEIYNYRGDISRNVPSSARNERHP